MKVEVSQEPLSSLEEYAIIPISFEVRLVFDIADTVNSLGEVVLTERSLDIPYVKDYDAIKGEHPARWASGCN